MGRHLVWAMVAGLGMGTSSLQAQSCGLYPYVYPVGPGIVSPPVIISPWSWRERIGVPMVGPPQVIWVVPLAAAPPLRTPQVDIQTAPRPASSSDSPVSRIGSKDRSNPHAETGTGHQPTIHQTEQAGTQPSASREGTVKTTPDPQRMAPNLSPLNTDGTGMAEQRPGGTSAPLAPLAPPSGGLQPAANQAAQTPLPPLVLPGTPSSPRGSQSAPQPADDQKQANDYIPPPQVPLPAPAGPPKTGQEPLPPLTLPPEIPPVVPPPPLPPSSGSLAAPATSRYRPAQVTHEQKETSLTSGIHLQVRVQHWSVPPTPDGYRLLRFLNYTDQPLRLSIEGRAVDLPARSQLPVWVGPQVRWRLGSESEQLLIWPAQVGGADVVVRASDSK